MKLKIEKWLESQRNSENINKLFNESILCYKIGAYRASLLFSYVGFLTIIKERLIKAKNTKNIPAGQWNALINKLQNENSWEAAVFDSTQQSTNPIFPISDSQRLQIKYWKDRRNDCAHFKDNEITNCHVENFWSYIESNLSKITVEGGKNTLLNRIKVHYDPSLTPPDKSIEYLVTDIEHSVDSSELLEFWTESSRTIEDEAEFGFGHDNILKFYDLILRISPERIKNSLINFLEQNEKLELDFIENYPNYITIMNWSPQKIRCLWKEGKIRSYSIYTALLLNNMIPQNEIEEANELMISKLDVEPYKEIEHVVLSTNGFGTTLHKLAFENKYFKNWEWVNRKADLLKYYIHKYPLSEKAVEVMCEYFDRDNYSFRLSEKLNKVFNENILKAEEFIKIADSNKFKLPRHLKFPNSLLPLA